MYRTFFYDTVCSHIMFSSLFFLMIRGPPRSTLDRSSAASDVYKRQAVGHGAGGGSDCVGLKENGRWIRRRRDRRGYGGCLLYTSPSPRDRTRSRMPSSH